MDDELNYLNKVRFEHLQNSRRSRRSPQETIMPINAEIVKRPLSAPIAVAAPEIPVDASLSGGFQVFPHKIILILGNNSNTRTFTSKYSDKTRSFKACGFARRD